jgi:phosphate:Na+ symporter
LQSVENNLIEALDALLCTGIDAMESASAEDAEMLGLLTASPGDVVDRLRRNYLREEQHLAHPERILILSVLSQYERIVWSLQQLSRSLQTELETESKPAAATA